MTTDFIPARPWNGGHRMTVYAWGKRRRFPSLPAPEPRWFRVADDTTVLAECHWQRQPRRSPTILALHGLEGSSRAHYMRGIADKAFRAGANVVLLNQRTCGGTDALTPRLYHSGLIEDPLAVLRELVERDGLPAFGVAGYSLGGNLAVRLAGVLGKDAPPELRAVAAVSPTIELPVCIQALEHWSNRLYEWHFLKSLKRRMRRRALLYPGLYSIDELWRIRSIRRFDDRYTAPHHGFRDAADYYERASAMRVIDRVAVPSLIITAEDDPFVPAAPLRDPRVTANPHVLALITRHGGHCGFIAAPSPGFDGYWAEAHLVSFLLEHSLLDD